MADYVLVWAGERETDLRISAHFARIGNSVNPDPWVKLVDGKLELN